MTIDELCEKAHINARSKGFYDINCNLPELLMLTVSELSEALEADRLDKWDFESGGDIETQKDCVEFEIADAFIRLADLCAHYDIPIEYYIERKMAYNATRERMHGKKY